MESLAFHLFVVWQLFLLCALMTVVVHSFVANSSLLWFGGFFVCFLLFLVIKSFYFRNSIPVVRAKDGSLPRVPFKKQVPRQSKNSV